MAKYEGALDEAERYDGEGSAQFVGGHAYVGAFANGMMDGQGKYTWADGRSHVLASDGGEMYEAEWHWEIGRASCRERV